MFLWKAFVVYFVLISFSNAVLKTKPENTVSLRGRRVELKCRSDAQNPIDWSFTAVGSPVPQQFYFNGKFYPNSSSSRFKVLRNESGQYDLIIDSVDFSYAGNYKCNPRTTENKQSDQWYSAELVVLDSDPICKANSVSGSEEYEIIATECQINYRGNAKPRMECTVNDDIAIVNSILTVNYTDYTYRDNTTLTNITSSVMTSSVTIPKVQTTNITCNITFTLINSDIDNNFEYSHLWTYAPKHRSRDTADGKGNENTDSPPYIVIIVACVLGVLCFITLQLLSLLRRKFCSRQKKEENRHSEPEVLVAMQSHEQSVKCEEIQLPDPPDAPPSDVQVADPNFNQSASNAVEDGKKHTSGDVRKSSSSNGNEAAYEKPAKMERLGPDEQQKMYERLHIYANTILATDYENKL